VPAHLKEIWHSPCGWAGCEKEATKKLFNTWNAEINSYCTRHATVALKDYQRKYEGGKEG